MEILAVTVPSTEMATSNPAYNLHNALNRHPSPPTGDGWHYQDKHYLHPHWLRYEAPSYDVHFFVGMIVAICGIVAVIGNTLVIFVFSRFKNMRSSSNLLTVNLAVSDLLMATADFPHVAASFRGYWIFSNTFCVVYGAWCTTFGLLSINTMCAIAVDRYIVLGRSFTKFGQTSQKYVILLLVACWFNPLLWSIPPLFGWNQYILEGSGTSCSINFLNPTPAYRALIWAMFVFGFSVPLALITYCYSYIYWNIHKHEKIMRKMSRQASMRVTRGAQERRRNTELRTARTLLISVILYCVSWLPYSVVVLLGVTGNQNRITPIICMIGSNFAKVGTVYNPFLYSLSHPTFKKKLRFLCGWRTSLSSHREESTEQGSYYTDRMVSLPGRSSNRMSSVRSSTRYQTHSAASPSESRRMRNSLRSSGARALERRDALQSRRTLQNGETPSPSASVKNGGPVDLSLPIQPLLSDGESLPRVTDSRGETRAQGRERLLPKWKDAATNLSPTVLRETIELLERALADMGKAEHVRSVETNLDATLAENQCDT